LLNKSLAMDERNAIIWNKTGFGSYLACSACGYILMRKLFYFYKTIARKEQRDMPFLRERARFVKNMQFV
jgi:hypothetical protein